MNRFRHRKTLILIGALGQTILWVPLLALPLLFPEHGAWLLIACTVLYVSMGHFSVPAWTSLITDFVDPRQRGVYFGRRAKIMAVTSFAVLLGAGFVLQSAKLWREPWMGFAVIFIVASAARGVSTYYLARIEERSVEGTRETEFRLMEFIRGQHGSNFQRFLLFSGLMHVCVLIAGPYFLIYLLRDLQFSYLMYAAWMAAGTLGQFLTLKSWGRLGDRFGNKKVLVATGILVPFLPMLYIVSTNFYFLVLVNLFGGIVWAGLSMGLQNYIFDTVRAEDRAKSVAVWNTVNAVGWCIGALLGGWLAMIAIRNRHWGLAHPADVEFAGGVLRIRAAASAGFADIVGNLPGSARCGTNHLSGIVGRTSAHQANGRRPGDWDQTGGRDESRCPDMVDADRQAEIHRHCWTARNVATPAERGKMAYSFRGFVMIE